MVELLTTIGIIAVLGTVTVIFVNPPELLAQGRDGRRISDVGVLALEIQSALSQARDADKSDQNYVYISLPGNPDCDAYIDKLPPLEETSYRYRCATLENYRNLDGTGWLPIDFQNLTSPTQMSSLPVDPVNAIVTGDGLYYYAYVPGWELNANLESEKYKFGGSADAESTDDGDQPHLFEIASNFGLMPWEAGEWTTRVESPELCGGNSNPAFVAEEYSRWLFSGAGGQVETHRIWLWQGDGSLAKNEYLEMALYTDTEQGSGDPDGIKITDTIFVYGTGVTGWTSGQLPRPLSINSGQNYIFGMGPSSPSIEIYFNLASDWSSYCDNYLPKVASYDSTKDGVLGNIVPDGAIGGSHKGFPGISYVKIP